jgi:hypothetical protein
MNQFLKSLFVCSAFIILLSCAGVKKTIQHTEAFVLQPQQGNVQVDEKGNEVSPLPQKLIVIFVQSKSADVKWDSAWFGNKSLSVSQQLISQTLEMGVEENTGKKIVITPAEGMYLFQLQVQPQLLKGEEWASSIRIRGSLRNKSIYTEVTPIRPLQLPDAQ